MPTPKFTPEQITESLIKRLEAKLDKNGPVPICRPDLGPCWLWTGRVEDNGYAKITTNKRRKYVHRVSYEIRVGAIPDGLDIDHLCRNRCCGNPEHLEPVTRKVNIRRGIGVGGWQVRKTHCPHGHPYSGGNLYIKPNGNRVCITCRTAAKRASRRTAA